MAKEVELYPHLDVVSRPSPNLSRDSTGLKAQITAEIFDALQPWLEGPNGGRLRGWLSSKKAREKLNVSGATLRLLRDRGERPFAVFVGQDTQEMARVLVQGRRSAIWRHAAGGAAQPSPRELYREYSGARSRLEL